MRVVLPWLLAVGIGAMVSCREATQIEVELTTDLKCVDVRGTSLTIGSLEEIEQKPATTVTTQCDLSAARIGSIVIVPSGANDESVAVRIVLGFGRDPAECVPPSYGPGCIVARRALRYLPHTRLTLPIFLSSTCNGIACGATETCVRGNCRSATIDDTSTCIAGCGEDKLGDGRPLPIADAGSDVADARSDVVDAGIDATIAMCPEDGGVRFGGHCYFLLPAPLTELAARTSCIAAGAHLVTITSAAEQDVVKNAANVDRWIGLENPTPGVGTKDDQRAAYRWVTGEPKTASFWYVADPDQGVGCASMHGTIREWVDRACTDLNPAVCERE